jgi:regulation of enolase protein 1 (concanavalin A-like superfamily)
MWIANARADWEALREALRASLVYGGPTEISLQMLLTRMEETCHSMGTGATFVALCDEMAAEFKRVGVRAPLQQWFGVPAAPRVVTGEPLVREEFSGDGWHPALEWRDVTGRTRQERAARPGWLGLYPATDADLWPEKNLNAPRLVTRVQGDFVAQTRVELGEGGDVYAGLLVWQDPHHFVRLELHRVPGKRAGVDLAACVEGRFHLIGRGNCERRPVWLRLERVGDELRGFSSADGEQWLAYGTVRMPHGKDEVVGLAAHSTYPNDHAWFDAFYLWLG